MSAFLVGRALWTDIQAHLKLTLVILADAANDEGFCYPGQERIATQLGQDVRQARRNIKALEELGLISVAIRPGTGSGRHSNAYQINIEMLGFPPLKGNRTHSSDCQATGHPCPDGQPDIQGRATGHPGQATGHPCPPNHKKNHKEEPSEIRAREKMNGSSGKRSWKIDDARAGADAPQPSRKKQKTSADELISQATVPSHCDRDELQRWVEWKQDSRKPYQDKRGVSAAANILSRFPLHIQRSMIDSAIAGGWQGLHEPKGALGYQPTPTQREIRADEF